MKNFTSILIALLLITGCANAPRETSTKLTLGLVQSTVTKGANQSEITKTLGKEMRHGLMIGFQENQHQVAQLE